MRKAEKVFSIQLIRRLIADMEAAERSSLVEDVTDQAGNLVRNSGGARSAEMIPRQGESAGLAVEAQGAGGQAEARLSSAATGSMQKELSEVGKSQTRPGSGRGSHYVENGDGSEGLGGAVSRSQHRWGSGGSLVMTAHEEVIAHSPVDAPGSPESQASQELPDFGLMEGTIDIRSSLLNEVSGALNLPVVTVSNGECWVHCSCCGHRMQRMSLHLACAPMR